MAGPGWRLLDLKLSCYARPGFYPPPILSWKAEGKIPNPFSLIAFEKPTGQITAAKEDDFFMAKKGAIKRQKGKIERSILRITSTL
jgi:hypothetical protein